MSLASSGLISPSLSGYLPRDRYSNPGCALGANTATISRSTGFTYYQPFYLPEPRTLVEVGFYQTTTSTANRRICIARADGDWQPAALTVDLGEAAAVSGKNTLSSLDYPLAPGPYLWGWRAAASMTFNYSGSTMEGWMPLPSTMQTAGQTWKAETYGAWSSPPTAWDNSNYAGTGIHVFLYGIFK